VGEGVARLQYFSWNAIVVSDYAESDRDILYERLKLRSVVHDLQCGLGQGVRDLRMNVVSSGRQHHFIRGGQGDFDSLAPRQY